MHLNANGSRQLIGLCNKIFCFIFRVSPSVSLCHCLMLFFFWRFTRGDTRITITINALFSVCAAHKRLMEWKHATCIRKNHACYAYATAVRQRSSLRLRRLRLRLRPSRKPNASSCGCMQRPRLVRKRFALT